MKFSIFGLSLLLFLGTEVYAQSEILEFIGHSHKASILSISPDGKWLISWDGVTLNTPAPKPSDRKVWNLATKKWRDISKWSESYKIYDAPCGWTPDNRIWQLRTNPQPLADGNAPYTGEFYLENPNGSGKVFCTDPHEKVWFDDQSYFDDVVAQHFSADGKQLMVLSNSYFRIFDTIEGKMTFRRRLQPSERREADLSDDGRTILAVTVEEKQQWQLREARSGRLLQTLKAPKDAVSSYLIGKNLFAYENSKGSMVYCRLRDSKVLWARGDETRRTEFVTKLWVWNNIDGRDRVFAAPEREQWVALAISPNRKTMIGVNPKGDLYRFAAHEIKP